MSDESLGILKNVATTVAIGKFFKDGAVVPSPTLAAGDVTIHIGLSANGANIGSLPVAIGDSTDQHKQALTQPETNEDWIVIDYQDAAGDGWDAFSVILRTATNRNSDLSTVTTAQVNAECDTALTNYDGPTHTELVSEINDVQTDIAALNNISEAQVNAQCDTALTDYDGPTDAEMDAGFAGLNDPTAAAIAAAVWVAGTRTLTSFGTLIADIWAYASRTLTQTAAEVEDAIDGGRLTVTAGVTLDTTLSGLTIPATWEKIYLTAQRSKLHADAKALVQWVVSNPGVAADGLQRLNGAAATAAEGSLTVDQAAGTIDIYLADDASDVFPKPITGTWDVKVLRSDGESQQPTTGDFLVQMTDTKAIT